MTVISLVDKVALVTGGGGGIGRAVSLNLCKAGARVVVADFDRHLGEQTVQLIRDEGGDALFVHADVSRPEDVKHYVETTLASFGRVDVFMNNAGWEGVVRPLVDYPTDLFDKVWAINVRGVFLGLKHVLPVMIAQRNGAIVNTASGAGVAGTPNMAAYCASKHAVVGLTKTAALEVAKLGIRVNAVCPGPVATRMMSALGESFAPGAAEAWRQQRVDAIPDGRYGEPEEVANLMLYLASDMASHITGQAIGIDGGVR